ncbi:MAG: hypothetical protein IPK87_07370 [Planctomycetes bacterium]|nr:hypothetical protein [Planctomycetota bacterium]
MEDDNENCPTCAPGGLKVSTHNGRGRVEVPEDFLAHKLGTIDAQIAEGMAMAERLAAARQKRDSGPATRPSQSYQPQEPSAPKRPAGNFIFDPLTLTAENQQSVPSSDTSRPRNNQFTLAETEHASLLGIGPPPGLPTTIQFTLAETDAGSVLPGVTQVTHRINGLSEALQYPMSEVDEGQVQLLAPDLEDKIRGPYVPQRWGSPSGKKVEPYKERNRVLRLPSEPQACGWEKWYADTYYYLTHLRFKFEQVFELGTAPSPEPDYKNYGGKDPKATDEDKWEYLLILAGQLLIAPLLQLLEQLLENSLLAKGLPTSLVGAKGLEGDAYANAKGAADAYEAKHGAVCEAACHLEIYVQHVACTDVIIHAYPKLTWEWVPFAPPGAGDVIFSIKAQWEYDIAVRYRMDYEFRAVCENGD